MSSGFYRIQIRKEAIKFSSAHMTVFPDGTKESLHGHNYQIGLTVELTDASLKSMISYADFKVVLKSLAEKWDEKLLIAEKCPFFECLKKDSHEIEFRLCGKRYVIPSDEIVFLPIENITTELLSRELSGQLISRLDDKILKKLKSLVVLVEESGGQGSSYVWTN